MCVHTPVISTAEPRRHGRKRERRRKKKQKKKNDIHRTPSDKTVVVFTTIIWVSSHVYFKKDRADSVSKFKRAEGVKKENCSLRSLGG